MAPIATSPVRQQQPRLSKSGQSVEEQLYQEATKAFLTRQYSATHQALQKLLALVPPRSSSAPSWYEQLVVSHATDRDLEAWRTKSIKLSITHYADLRNTNPAAASVPAELRELLPPAPSTLALENGLELCRRQYAASEELQRVPATMIATLAMASLRLGPEGVSFVKRVIEDWLAALPQELELAMGGKKAEGVTEDYLKVVELYVGEILTRDGEWEMASMFLETEALMPSKRKESLFLKLRSLKMRAKAAEPRPTSPIPMLSASMELPPSSPIARSRRSSTSSSSSERTARPAVTSVHPQSLAIPGRPSRKGKEKAIDVEVDQVDEKPEGTTSTSTSPSAGTSFGTALGTARDLWSQLAARIPHSLYPSTKRRITFLPITLILSLLVFMLRTRGNRRAQLGQATSVRDRLRMRQGWRQWLLWWLLQSWQKTKGVLKLGTTITYI